MNKDMINLYKYVLEYKYKIKTTSVEDNVYNLEVIDLSKLYIRHYITFQLLPCPGKIVCKSRDVISFQHDIVPVKPV